MKIFFDYKIFWDQPYGGVSRYFIELSKNLSYLGENPFICAPVHKNQLLDNFDSNWIFGRYSKEIKNRYFGKIINEFETQLKLFKLKPDIIHTTYFSKSLLNYRKPLVVTVYDLIHEIYYEQYKKDKNFRPKKNILEKADKIICISENTKKDLFKFYNIDKSKVSVIYLGSFIEKENLTFNFKTRRKYFLYVGSRKGYKNFNNFIESFSKNQILMNEFDIVCFGGGKFNANELELFNKNNIHKDQIIQISDNDKILCHLYKNAVALVYPSKYEGFGLPILEAMENSCPVISSNSSSLPEVYGDAALTFDPNYNEELTTQMLKIAEDNDIKNNMIEKGLKRTKIFSFKKCAQETKKLYKELL